jgi:hypothetical protein
MPKISPDTDPVNTGDCALWFENGKKWEAPFRGYVVSDPNLTKAATTKVL